MAEEARALGFEVLAREPGGVLIAGGWAEVMRANLWLATPSRVLWRIGGFPAVHLAVLDRRARRFPWGQWLKRTVPVRVEVECTASRIWHEAAAAERIARAIDETLGAPIATAGGVTVKARIADDFVTLSLDTSGAGLWQRGWRRVGLAAPLRETLAASFLRVAGWKGEETVLDPMCGSGTFPIEAAGHALGLAPGRLRQFAFEQLEGFDAKAWEALRAASAQAPAAGPPSAYGLDHSAAAVRSALENARRAGVAERLLLRQCKISALSPPKDVRPGLVITNPPWGKRLGDRKELFALYARLGQVLRSRFSAWRVAVVSPDPALVGAIELGLKPACPPVPSGGTRVQLWLGAVSP